MSSTPTITQPANAVEQRIYDLLRPFRDEYHIIKNGDDHECAQAALKLERKVIILSQNIAFLAHNHVDNTERQLGAEDIFVVMRGLSGDEAAETCGVIAVLVRYPAGTKGVVKASFKEGPKIIDALCGRVDEMLAEVI